MKSAIDVFTQSEPKADNWPGAHFYVEIILLGFLQPRQLAYEGDIVGRPRKSRYRDGNPRRLRVWRRNLSRDPTVR